MVTAVPPSPKYHLYESVPIEIDEVFVKTKLLPVKHCLSLLMVKFVVPEGYTYTVRVIESLHEKPEVVTSLTLKVPEVVYECVGLADVEVIPSPKYHI